MDWMSCQNVFNSITKESANRKVRFVSPLTAAVGEFYRQVSAVPEERRSAFWLQSGGTVQKWAQEELFALGYTDQRFKYKKNGSYTEIEFFMQNLTHGSPVEALGQDTVEVVLQAFYVAIKDS